MLLCYAVNKDLYNVGVVVYTYVQVHVRLRPCFGSTRVSCVCGVVAREFNNILGVFGCRRGQPPVPVRYLIDDKAPADDIALSRDGTLYTVYWPCLHAVFTIIIVISSV